MFKKASILGLSLLLIFYPTAGFANELEDQQQTDKQSEIQPETNIESSEQKDIQETSADPLMEDANTETPDTETNEVQEEPVEASDSEPFSEEDDATEEVNVTEDEAIDSNNVVDEANADETANESEENQEQETQQLTENEEENQNTEQLDEDLDLSNIYGAINQRSGTTIEYDFNKGYYTLQLQAGLSNYSSSQVLTDKWIAFALPNGVHLANQDVPAGVVELNVNGKNGLAIKIPDVGEFPDSKYVYHELPLVGEPNDNDPVLNLYLYNVDVDQLTYENLGQIKQTRKIDFTPMVGTPELEVDANFSGQASFDQDKGYYVLDLNVHATNQTNSDVSSIYGAFTLPEGVRIIDTGDALDGIELLHLADNSIAVAVKLPELESEEDGQITYQIPLLGKATENITTSTIYAYTINGSYQEVGQLNGSVDIDLSDMNETWSFGAEGQIVGDYPGLDAGQLGLRFAFTTNNLTWDSVDRVTVEFLVPDAITIFEPDSYETGQIPDSLKDFLESDMSSSTDLDLTWDGNTATIDLDTVDAAAGFQGWFTAFGETDAALSDLEGLNVIVTLFQNGEEIAKEISVPFEIVTYEGEPVDPNEDEPVEEDETPREDNEGSNDESKDESNENNNEDVNVDPNEEADDRSKEEVKDKANEDSKEEANDDISSKDENELQITPIENNENDNNDQEKNKEEQTTNKVNNNDNNGSNSSIKGDGAELPNTATTMYSILLVGTVLTVAGATLFLIRNRRKAMNE